MLTWPAPHVPLVPGTGPALRLFDAAHSQVLVAGGPGPAGILVCSALPVSGPHLGDLATAVAADLVVRAWRDAGLAVTHVEVLDDTSESVVSAAVASGRDAREVAHEAAARLEEDLTNLGLLPPDRLVAVGEALPGAVGLVEELLANGAAYRVALPDGPDGTSRADVYADLHADPALHGVPRHAPDPVLWRAEREGEPALDGASLGRGRPGASITCAAAALAHLAGGVDVLVAGRELALQAAVYESHVRVLRAVPRPVQRHVQPGAVQSAGRPMGEGQDAAVRLADLLADGVPPVAIRLHVLAHHYRSAWEHTEAGLAEAVARLETWIAAVSGNGGPDPEETVAEVRAAVADDLDTPRALLAVDAWAERALTYGRSGGLTDADMVEGAPGVVARAVDALLGVRL